MPQIKANGISLEYESRGDPGAEAILLIMGLGGQMTRWSPAFTDKLVARGYRVITFDNRDVGLTEKIEAAGAPDMGAIVSAVAAGQKAPVAYVLSDMAADAVGLLDALGIGRAHIVGASMGGMIAQLVAADYPRHTLSLTSIMSTTGNPDLPRATPEAMAVINSRGPDPAIDLEGLRRPRRQGIADHRLAGLSSDEARCARASWPTMAAHSIRRASMRQYAGVMASPDRRPKLKTITAPTVVVHGEADPH